MSTCNDVRKLALALEGVEEVDHWGRPAFRTKKRIFITLRPEEDRAVFHLSDEHQDLLFELRSEAFEPLHWGKVTRCFVNLKKVPGRELALLVREARDYAAPAISSKRTKGRLDIAGKGAGRTKKKTHKARHR